MRKRLQSRLLMVVCFAKELDHGRRVTSHFFRSHFSSTRAYNLTCRVSMWQEAACVYHESMPKLVLRTLCDEYDNGLKMFYEELLSVANGRGPKRLLLRKEFADGTKEYYEGMNGEERLVRAELADGTTAFYEGGRGGERQMHVEDGGGTTIWTRYGASHGQTAQQDKAGEEAEQHVSTSQQAFTDLIHAATCGRNAEEVGTQEQRQVAASSQQQALSEFINAAAACGRSLRPSGVSSSPGYASYTPVSDSQLANPGQHPIERSGLGRLA